MVGAFSRRSQVRETNMYPDSRVPRIPLYFASEGADVVFLFPGGGRNHAVSMGDQAL